MHQHETHETVYDVQIIIKLALMEETLKRQEIVETRSMLINSSTM